MRKWLLLVLLVFTWAEIGSSEDSSFSVDQLLELLSGDAVQPRAYESLSPEWIGMVKNVFPKPGAGEAEPNHLRLSHGAIIKSRWWPSPSKPETYGVIARLRPHGSGLGVEFPRYHEMLPTVEALAKCTTSSGLTKLLGPSHFPTSGWGDSDGRFHWTAGWTGFTRLEKDRLRYLFVGASFSGTKGGKESRIDSLRVREGSFRPADPDSEEERKKYLSGDILEARDEAMKKAQREKYPRPLRDLLEANEAPGDSDLKIYGTYLDGFRRNPDPKLLEQILAHAEWDPVTYEGFLEGIFTDRIDSMVEELEEWEPGKRRIALGYLIDALSKCQGDEALLAGIKVILNSLGGGKLKLKDPATRKSIDLVVRKNGYSYRSVDYSPELVKLAQEELRRRLEKSEKKAAK